MAEIKIHSITSLITNSSTTIFTYSENSEAKVRELFDLLIKDFGFLHSFDQMFSTVILFEDSSYYDRYLEMYNEEDEPDENDNRKKVIEQFSNSSERRYKLIEQLHTDVSMGLIPKPDWFTEAEEYDYENLDYSNPGTTLYINAKDEKYKPLADKLFNVIYSTTSEYCET